jgi:acyl-coenzyme A thioesterase PaaI-like protein
MNNQHVPNRLERQLSRLAKIPKYFQPWAQSQGLHRAAPFTGTAGIRVVVISNDLVEVRLANRRKVQNHINGVHAAAMTLLAETATGAVVGMNVRDDCLPVAKELRVRFRKRATGALRAVATLTPEQRALIKSTDKGEVSVSVVVTDEANIHPIECESIWAWIPNQRNQVSQD